MNTRFLTLTLLLFAFKFSIAQDLPTVIHPTPDVMAFNKFGAAPPSLYTGIPNISVPLYTVSSEHGFQLPLGINYHASGIKVDEVSSIVGLGWSLNAGGSISRTIRGRDDFGNGGYANATSDFGSAAPYNHPYLLMPDANSFNPNIYSYPSSGTGYQTNTSNYDYFYARAVIVGDFENKEWGYGSPASYASDASGESAIITTAIDGEPDEFNYSLPTGESGKFYLDQTGKAVLVPRKNLDIQASDGTCTITDSQGNTFLYGAAESSDNDFTDAMFVGGATTSWKLTSIITPQGDTIHLKYKTNSYSYYSSRTESQYILTSTTAGGCGAEPVIPFNISEDMIYTTHSERLLDSIIFRKNAFVKFHYNDTPGLEVDQVTYRRDLVGAKILRKIEVNNGYKTIKNIEFDQTYFESPATTVWTSSVYTQPNYNTTKDKDQKKYRLKLTGVIETLSQATHSFEYNETVKLPARFHNSQDIWGYYNSGGNGTPGQDHLFYSTTNYSGADGSADETYTQANILTKVTYPTKGSSFYEYENHRYNTTSGIEIVGGLRVKKITNTTDLEAQVTRYEYKNPTTSVESGQLGDTPVFESDYSQVHITGLDPYGEWIGSDSNKYFEPYYLGLDKLCYYKKRSYHSILPLGTYSGSPVAYPYATEIQGDNGENGRVTYEFEHNPNTYTGYFTAFYYPFTPLTSNAWKSGLLKKKTVYKSPVSGDPYALSLKVQELENTYAIDDSHNSTANPTYNVSNEVVLKGFKGIVTKKTSDDYGLGGVDMSIVQTPLLTGVPYLYEFETTFYDITTGWVQPIQTIQRQFDADGSGGYVETVSTNTFGNPDHLQVTQTKTEVSDEKPVFTKIFYPDDVSPSVLLDNMDVQSESEKDAIYRLQEDDLHQTGTPIQVETYKDTNDDGVLSTSELTSVQRTNFEEWYTGIVLPESIETLKGTYNSSTNKSQTRITFQSYYDNGNIKEVSKKDGPPIVYIWGYDQQYPIAKVENATYAEVSSQVSNLQTKSDLDDDTCLDTESCDEKNLRTALTTLRNTASLSDAMVTTYTYDPLVGLTSITDPKGYTIYYEYDTANRLEYVKDKDGKILSKNKYHYKGQQ